MSNQQKNDSFKEQLIAWVNGEREPKDQTLFVMECRLPRPERPEEEQKVHEKRRLRKFLGWYPVAGTLICITLVAILLKAVLAMPTFGHPDNPTNNEVPSYYMEHTIEDTGAENAVTGMILTYRGFDTLGESCVLFMAVTAVMILLLDDKKILDHQNRRRQEQEAALERRNRDIILQNTAKLLTPYIFLFAVYVLLNGEVSPGGGFSSGTVLGAGLILYASAFGFDKLHAFFNRRVFDTIRIFGLMLYALLYGYFTYTGANGRDNHLAVLGGLSLPIDIAVGMVVACTVYGFYALFKRGEL